LDCSGRNGESKGNTKGNLLASRLIILLKKNSLNTCLITKLRFFASVNSCFYFDVAKDSILRQGHPSLPFANASFSNSAHTGTCTLLVWNYAQHTKNKNPHSLEDSCFFDDDISLSSRTGSILRLVVVILERQKQFLPSSELKY